MNRNLLFFLFFMTFCFYIFSQEEAEQEEDTEIENIFDEYTIFVINSFNFNISGKTRPFALINEGNLRTGEELIGIHELEEYIREKTQILFNNRVLSSVSLDYTVGEAQEDGRYPVDIVVNTSDTQNFIVIPHPSYSSSSGFEFTLKARDYNFLGTMVPFKLDIGYIFDENENNIFLLELDANLPFRAFNLNWNFLFYNSYEYHPDLLEANNFFTNITGISVDFPIGSATLTLGFNESFIYNQENLSVYKEIDGDYQFGFYMSSNPYVSWRIPMGLEIGNHGELVYTPGISAVFNHEFSNWELLPHRKGPFLIFSHNLGFKRVDWIGNFMRGFDVSLYNSFQYDFYRAGNDEEPVTGLITFTGIGHFTVTDFFGISSRLKYRHLLFYERGDPEAGDVLRGIKDDNLRADYILSLNLDLPVRILRFSPSVWFDNPGMRLFNFDLHFAPVLDFALYHDPVKNINFSFDNYLLTGGFEFIFFPESFRSLLLRVSMCWDLHDSRNYELFIGTDLHY